MLYYNLVIDSLYISGGSLAKYGFLEQHKFNLIKSGYKKTLWLRNRATEKI
jgi:hypothetical protein